MLDQKDLDAIRAIMKEEIAKSENLVLDELDRVQVSLERKMEAVKKNIEELNQYYRITKLENDNTALLLKLIDELSKKVEELEKKIA